jgi:hypothetical protein
MKQPIDVIVENSAVRWRHIATGAFFSIVWASPLEVLAVNMDSTWHGRAVEFVSEFEAIVR